VEHRTYTEWWLVFEPAPRSRLHRYNGRLVRWGKSSTRELAVDTLPDAKKTTSHALRWGIIEVTIIETRSEPDWLEA